jgi:2,3-bisphosphoglycerate-independent phosphoglycerate mutase
MDHVRSTGGSLHMLGLISDGRVHSDLEHAFAVIELARRYGIRPDRLIVHAITDGRDTAPTSGLGFIEQLESRLAEAGVGRIGSVIGRYYAMDRDLRWDRVRSAYELLTRGTGHSAPTAADAVQSYYQHPSDSSRHGDEFIVPTAVGQTPAAIAASRVGDGDAVIFTNYRGDRTRELTKAFVFADAAWKQIDGGGFDRGQRIDNLLFATMTGYEVGLPVQVIFEKRPKMPHILGQYISSLGLKQFRCAETEKYPHVSFFFNDYRDDPFPGEDWCLVASPRDVATYDRKPEMSAYPVTEEVLQRIALDQYALIVVNYANGDMVGHTGVLEAAIRAVETVDECVGRLVEATLAHGGSLIVTADHGNCEQMIDPATGGPHTAHTTYDVPLIVVEPGLRATLRAGGRLADIAPTALELMGLPIPEEMTGSSLIVHAREKLVR